jgi:hypothetical protein
MTTSNFLLALMVGSALVAFWVVARFPDKGPATFKAAFLHIGASLAAGFFVPPAFGFLLTWGQAAAMAAIFGILLPFTVYSFLATGWFLKLVVSAFQQYRN